MVKLIFDRKNEDVARLKTLRTKVKNRTATIKEYEEWLSSLKGAYNNTDFNRVGEAINYLADLLNSYGYKNDAVARTNWEVSEKPNQEQMNDYLNNLNKLKECYSVKPNTPDLPFNMEKLTFAEANNIEKILYDINELIEGMKQNFIMCGVPSCGQSRIWQQRFRRTIKRVGSWEEIKDKTWIEYGETTTWENII